MRHGYTLANLSQLPKHNHSLSLQNSPNRNQTIERNPHNNKHLITLGTSKDGFGFNAPSTHQVSELDFPSAGSRGAWRIVLGISGELPLDKFTDQSLYCIQSIFKAYQSIHLFGPEISPEARFLWPRKQHRFVKSSSDIVQQCST